MNIKETEDEILQMFKNGKISYRDFVELTLSALEDEATYPDAEAGLEED